MNTQPGATGRPGGGQSGSHAFVGLVVAMLVLMLPLMFLPLYMHRSVLPPLDAVVSGPLYGGLLTFVPPVALFMYLLLSPLVARATGGNWRQGTVYVLPTRGFAGVLTRAVFIGCTVAYWSGVNSCWFATPDGIKIHPGLFAHAPMYPWRDILGREVSCFMSRGGGRNVRFRVRLPNGWEVDLADTQQMQFAANAAWLAAQTAAAPVTDSTGNRRFCPAYVSSLLVVRQPTPASLMPAIRRFGEGAVLGQTMERLE